ncbi:MAG: hypothetical protein MJK12_03785 [Colwellia sp.]|nr:hypothetical protein [Colwellia sp.]
MIDIAKKAIGIIGLILSAGYTIDLIFYWPDSGYDTFYLIKLIAYIVGSSSIFWLFFLKEKFKATSLSK